MEDWRAGMVNSHARARRPHALKVPGQIVHARSRKSVDGRGKIERTDSVDVDEERWMDELSTAMDGHGRGLGKGEMREVSLASGLSIASSGPCARLTSRLPTHAAPMHVGN